MAPSHYGWGDVIVTIHEQARCALWFGAAIILAACHHASPEPHNSLADHVGVYQFTEHLTASGQAAETLDLDGEVVVTDDTVTVDARPGPCRFDTTLSIAYPFTYICGSNVTLRFDRQDPVLQARYTARLAQNQTHQACVRYETDSAGRRYCAETQTITTQSLVNVSGALRLTRVPGSDLRLFTT
ncbi:MAG: hypothetical protein ACREPM_24610, partial [Gemmatimonadaceae bacterium]